MIKFGTSIHKKGVIYKSWFNKNLKYTLGENVWSHLYKTKVKDLHTHTCLI